MAFDPFADPFSSFNPGFGGSSQPPKLPDKVAEDLLDQIGDGLVGGLGYIGGILDKPGRAIRGLADTLTGGGPQSLREALAILPFSDSIGLTKSDQRVSGKKILGNLGLIDDTPSQGFDENDAAGIGAELLLDPLSYLGIGTLTKGGNLLQKAGGNVKTGFTGRALGADLLQSNVDDFLSKFGGGVATARDLTTKSDSIIPAGVQGVRPRFNIVPETTEQTITFLANAKLPQNVQDIIKGGKQFGPSAYRKASFTPEGEALIHSLDIGDDAFKISTAKAVREATDDATRLGSTITLGKAPLGIDRLLGLEPFRIESPFLDRSLDAISAGIQGSKLGSGFSRLFDSRVGNARTPEVQATKREVGTPAREAYRADALGQSMEIRQKALGGFAPLVNPQNETELMRLARQGAELKAPYDAPSGINYSSPKTVAEYERQLATRPAENPIYPNRLDETKATGEFDAMANSFLGARQISEDMANFAKSIREGEQAVGVNSTELMDDFINYLPRQKNPLPRKPGEGPFAYAGRVLSDALRTTHEGQIQRQAVLKNIPGGTTQIEDWVKNAALRQMTPLQREAYLVEELTGNPISAATKPEIRQQAKGLSDWIMEQKDYTEGGISVFNKDLMASLERRALGGAAAKGGMDATLEAVRRFSIPEAEALAQGVPFTRVSEFLGQDGFGVAAKDLARRDLRLNSANELSGMVLPQDIAVDLAKTQKAWTQPEEVQGLLRLWDAGLQMFKGAVTYPFPAFHVRNIGSGIYNMWRDNAASGSAMRDAYKVLTSNADLPYITREQLVNEAVANRVAFTPHTKQFGDVLAPGESFIQGLPGKLNGEGLGENLLAGAKANAPESWKDVGFIVREGKAAGSMVEDWIRLSHYLAKKQQGFEPAAAAAAVRKYQYDYASFTQFERNTLKRLIPWWSFSRNNLPPLLEDIATQPAKLAGSVRVATSRPDGQFVPRYISEGPSIPLPGGAPGTDRYIASLGLPFEDELVRTIGNLAKGDTTRAVQQTIGTLAPAIKYPIEQAFGTQAHTGRKLEDLKATPAAELLSSVLPVTPQAANQLVGLTPLARFGSVSSQVADERKSVLDKIINLGTGAWITDVDATKARNVEVRDMLENLLRQNKGVSNFDKFYVKPENLPKLNPDELQAYLLYRNLEDKAKEQAAKRKAALPLPGGF